MIDINNPAKLPFPLSLVCILEIIFKDEEIIAMVL